MTFSRILLSWKSFCVFRKGEEKAELQHVEIRWVLMTAGVIVARSHRYGGFVKYQLLHYGEAWQTKGMSRSGIPQQRRSEHTVMFHEFTRSSCFHFSGS